MPPNVFIGHVTGDFLPAADWNSNWTLVENSFLDLSNGWVVTGLVPSAAAGLSVSVTSGLAVIGAEITVAASFNITGLTDNTTNYLWLQQNGTGTSNTSGSVPSGAAALLGLAITSGGAVTSVVTALTGAPFIPRAPFGHLLGGGGPAPVATAGAQAGTSPPSPVLAAGSNDLRGQVTFGSGTGPAAGADLVITFARGYAAAPAAFVMPANDATQQLGLWVSTTAAALTVSSHNAMAASQANTVYSVHFQVLG